MVITRRCSFEAALSECTVVAPAVTVYLLDEPIKLIRGLGAAEVGGPGVADGELVELQHVHDAHLGHSAAEQLGPLVHAGRWERDGDANK